MSEYEGLRKSDRVIVEELYQAVLDGIFDPIKPHLKKGMTKEQMADLITPWEARFPWPDGDTRVARLKEMYGPTVTEVFGGTGICEADGAPTKGFKDQILSRVEMLFLGFQ
jgi:hypothetical protein